jgi:Fic family protein
MSEDRGENIGLLEPLLVSESSPRRSALADLALELTARSTGFHRSLPEGVARALADLVRSMNCYYSNLIEGHNTHPIDIERALNNDYSDNLQKRNLQLEARAHIETQQWIDEDGLRGRATSVSGILECHRRFCASLPADLLWVENSESKERIEVLPGEFRRRDVAVGRHLAVSSGAVPRFLQRFEESYAKLGKVDSIIASATAHHRLLWIHPFLDGNGRVARLMSYAMLKDTLQTGGIWSIARGLARREGDYKQHLANCDLPRRNDLDGRGHLSEEALTDFASFFLETCLDQVSYMEELVQPNRLRDRILLWCEEEIRNDSLPPKSSAVLESVLFRGELPRSEIQSILDTGERNARRVTSTLIEQGILTSSSSRAPLRLNFPARLASRWMPGLFPEIPVSEGR